MGNIKSGRTRLASILAGTVMSAASLLGASLARASTTITRQNGGRTTIWSEIATSTDDGIEVNDATLSSTGDLNRNDAFDGAFNVYIYPSSDTNSTTSSEALIDVDATVVDNSPNGGSVSGTASAADFSNIGVDWSLVFASDAARVDGTFIIRNNGESDFIGFVGIKTNFGSDDETVIEATSSGDTTVATGDTWVVTSEDSEEGNNDDPVIVSASTSAGVQIGPDTDLDGDDSLVWRTPVDLAPGETVTINASHCLFETIAVAIAAANADDCVVLEEPAIPVPALTNPALLALAVLTGLLGAGSLVRRSKRKNLRAS